MGAKVRPMKIQFDIPQSEVAQLKRMVKRHPKAYVRERASALLQIQAGKSGLEVARQGLLRPRRENTIYEWVSRYKANGLASLLIQSGRGRKASYSPPKPGGS